MVDEIPKDIPLKEAFGIYRNRISVFKKGYPQESYRIDQISRSILGNKIVRSITSIDIANYRDSRLQTINPHSKKTLSASTVRLELSLLSNLFDVGRIEWGICDSNPVSNVRKPKLPPGRDRRLSAREEKKILRYCHAHKNRELLVIVIVALETAMRQSEILKLRWEHVNLKSRVAKLPDTKNGTSRDVPLSLKARDALISLTPKSDGPILTYTATGLKSTWRFMTTRLRIEDLHFHDLRHEAISRLFELGTLDMMEIAAISGHKSLAMLKRYTHLKAANLVQKLEGQKNRARAAVLSHMVPYPALLSDHDAGVSIRILDFEDLEVTARNVDHAIELARNELMRRIMIMMRESSQIPAPDQYLESVDEAKLLMLDPLGDVLRQNYRGSSKVGTPSMH